MTKTSCALLLLSTLLCAGAWSAGPVRCVMPNGTVITQNLGRCPADAAVWPDGQEKPLPPALRPVRGRLPVSRATWPGEWPFTLPAGELECQRLPHMPDLEAVLLHGDDGATYAVNGIASSHAARYGWRTLRQVWREDPAIPGARVPVGDMVARGRALCAGR